FQAERILKIDPATGALVASFPTNPATNLGGGLDGGLYLTQQDTIVLHVSPSSGTVLSSYPAPVSAEVFGVGFDGSNLWINDVLTDRIYRLEPHGGAVLATFTDPTPG